MFSDLPQVTQPERDRASLSDYPGQVFTHIMERGLTQRTPKMYPGHHQEIFVVFIGSLEPLC